MSKITNDDNPVWHRMLYSCAHMATVGIKGLIIRRGCMSQWPPGRVPTCFLMLVLHGFHF